MSSVYGSSAGAATNQQASSSSSSAAASSMLGAVPSKSIYSAHVGQAQKDGTLVVQAHTFALAAENASKNSKFREASARHLAAHDYFHSALKSSSWDYDPATADALGMLASYHESKSKEMRRLGRARESSTVTSSQAASSAIEAGSSAIETTSAPSSSASTSSASASTSGTPKKSTSSKERSPTGKTSSGSRGGKMQELYVEVERQFGKLQQVMVPGLGDASQRTGAGALGGNGNNSSGQGSDCNDIAALQEKVRLLTAENARLSRELAKANRLNQSKNSGPSEADLLREEFHKQFGLLKLSMQHFKIAYAQGDEDGRYKMLEQRVGELHSRVTRVKLKLDREKEGRHKAEKAKNELLQTNASLEQRLKSIMSSGH